MDPLHHRIDVMTGLPAPQVGHCIPQCVHTVVVLVLYNVCVVAVCILLISIGLELPGQGLVRLAAAVNFIVVYELNPVEHTVVTLDTGLHRQPAVLEFLYNLGLCTVRYDHTPPPAIGEQTVLYVCDVHTPPIEYLVHIHGEA